MNRMVTVDTVGNNVHATWDNHGGQKKYFTIYVGKQILYHLMSKITCDTITLNWRRGPWVIQSTTGRGRFPISSPLIKPSRISWPRTTTVGFHVDVPISVVSRVSEKSHCRLWTVEPKPFPFFVLRANQLEGKSSVECAAEVARWSESRLDALRRHTRKPLLVLEKRFLNIS